MLGYEPDRIVWALYKKHGFHPAMPPGTGAIIQAEFGRNVTYYSRSIPYGDGELRRLMPDAWRVVVHPSMPREVLAHAYARVLSRWVVDEWQLGICGDLVDDLARRIHVPTEAVVAARLSVVEPDELAAILVAEPRLVSLRWRETNRRSGVFTKI
jgi:hypothetical protein